MATFAKEILCFSLIILSTCFHTQARESKFFSKYIHFNTNNFVTIPTSTNLKKDIHSSPSPSQAPITSEISATPASAPTGEFSPAPAPAPIGAYYTPGSAPGPAPAENNEVSYYGLYGKNTNQEEEEGGEEEFSNENHEELNNGEAYTYNNGFWTSNQKSYYDTNNGYDSNGGFESEPQGMSDTRTVENGKYYYDNEQENNYGSSEPQGMSDTRLVKNENYYYGNEQANYSPSWSEKSDDGSKYEFDSMEEYEKQEGYADVEQQFTNP